MTERPLSEASLVYVEWTDSRQWYGWHDLAVVDQLVGDASTLTCRSLGFVVKEDADRLVLATSLNEEAGCFQGALSIPKDAIAYQLDLTDHIHDRGASPLSWQVPQ